MKPLRLSRRAVLRGFGLAPISVALPTLDAMLDGRGWFRDAAGQPTAPPVTFFTFFLPNGVYPDAFWPAGNGGSDYALSRCLMPLAPFKSDYNLYKNLSKDEAYRGQDVSTDAHARGHASFATGGSLKAGGGVEFASADQIAAAKLGGETRFRSLAVALGGIRPPVDNSQAYISWSAPTVPLPGERNPVALFNKLFAGGSTTAAPAAGAPGTPMADYTKSILDYVRADIADLQGKLGAHDRARLDQHLTSIRDLEQQLAPGAGAGGATPGSCTTAPAAPAASLASEPPGIDDGRGGYSNDRCQALMRLQVLAFSCGLTRFGSFMMANRRNKRQFPWLGATDGADGHHGISHDSTPAGYEKQAKIVTDEIQQFAFMLDLMKSSKQGEHDLLYNSLVFFAAEHGHGEAHDFSNTPVILAGNAGGKLKTGRFVVYPPKTRYANMFVTILNLLGVPTTSFGATGNGMLADVV